MIKKIFLPLVILIAILTFTLRIYKINSPVADWQSFRQADTAYVAKNYLKNGFDFLLPRDEDLSNIQSGMDNPLGYRLVEYPVYQLVSAGLAKQFPFLTVEVWLRLVNIIACVGTATLLIFIIAEYINPLTGLLAGFFYAVLPYSVYYGRAILPDTFAVFWSILSLFCITKIESKLTQSKQWLFLQIAGVSGAIALLVKPTAAFLLVPVPYLLWTKYKWTRDLIISSLVYGIISLIPIFAWRSWILNFPEGIPVLDFVLNKNGIRFKGAWFYWLFAVRLGDLILGVWGMILFGLGLIIKPTKKEGLLWWFMALGILLYFVIFASGNVQHDYYQILIIPLVSIFLARGCAYLFNNETHSRITSFMLAGVCLVLALSFSWYTIRTYYWINHPEIVEAGMAADKLLPPDAKVIASYNGDTAFLYQINRQGWPLGFDIEQKISLGATHYVTISPTDSDGETKALASIYKVLVRNDKYAIIDLRYKK